MNKIFQIFIFCGVLLLASYSAFASDFRVSPITMELAQYSNSGVFTVSNEGKEKYNFQISASEWTQDKSGNDVYAETKDVVFFPKIMTLEPGDQRVIRVGLKGPRLRDEATYRLFIEQIPSRDKKTGVNIAVSIRFAPPIFVKPVEIKTSGSIDTIKLENGKISAVVRNTGNVHFKMTSILFKGRSVSGAEVFSTEIASWYLLSHATRDIESSFPLDKCRDLATVEIEAQTETINLNGKMNVPKGMCSK